MCKPDKRGYFLEGAYHGGQALPVLRSRHRSRRYRAPVADPLDIVMHLQRRNTYNQGQ